MRDFLKVQKKWDNKLQHTFNEKQRPAQDPVLWRDDLMELFI